jgi:hypothetical protein
MFGRIANAFAFLSAAAALGLARVLLLAALMAPPALASQNNLFNPTTARCRA